MSNIFRNFNPVCGSKESPPNSDSVPQPVPPDHLDQHRHRLRLGLSDVAHRGPLHPRRVGPPGRLRPRRKPYWGVFEFYLYLYPICICLCSCICICICVCNVQPHWGRGEPSDQPLLLVGMGRRHVDGLWGENFLEMDVSDGCEAKISKRWLWEMVVGWKFPRYRCEVKISMIKLLWIPIQVAPKALSTRFISGMWYLFTLFMTFVN